MEGTAEIDSPLEGDGFEPLVPPWRESAVSTPLTAPFARSHTRNDKPPSASGPGVRIRFAPADSPSLVGFLLPVSKSRRLRQKQVTTAVAAEPSLLRLRA